MINYPIFILKLPVRVENTLFKNGIKNLSDLSDKNEKEILKIKNLGYKSIQIISNSIVKLLFNETQIISLTKYSFTFDQSVQLLSKALDSKSKVISNSAKKEDISLDSYSENLTKWILLSINSICSSSRQRIILEKRLRFLTKNSPLTALTLDEVGCLPNFQTTRERVRQIEKKILTKIDGFIISFNLQHKNEYKLFNNNLDQMLKELRVLSWPDELEFLNKKNLFDTDKLSKKFFRYFFEKEFYKNINIHFLKIKHNTFFIYNNSFDKKKTIKIINKILKYLNKSKKVEIQENVLFETVFPNNSLNQEEILILRKIISKLSNYRYSSNNKFKKKNLNIEDYACKILNINQKPMHFTELAKEINKISNKKRTINTIKNAFTAANSIHSVGKGKYALKEWKMKESIRIRYDNNLSVKNLVENYIKNYGKSENIKIINYVKGKRHASTHTINQAICDINKKYGYSKKNNKLSTSIIEYIDINGPSTVEDIFRNLKEKRTTLKKVSLYSYLYNSKFVSKKDNHWFLTNYYFDRFNHKDSTTIREKLANYLRNNNPATLDEIVNDLSKNTKTTRNTIRSYLSEMGIKADNNQKYSL